MTHLYTKKGPCEINRDVPTRTSCPPTVAVTPHLVNC